MVEVHLPRREPPAAIDTGVVFETSDEVTLPTVLFAHVTLFDALFYPALSRPIAMTVDTNQVTLFDFD